MKVNVVQNNIGTLILCAMKHKHYLRSLLLCFAENRKTALDGYKGHHEIVAMHFCSKTVTVKSDKDDTPVWGTWLLPHPGMRRLRSPQPGCEYGPWVLTHRQAAQTSSLPGPSLLNLAETPPPPAQDPARFQRLCFLIPVRPLVPNHPEKESRYGKVPNVVSWTQVSENTLAMNCYRFQTYVKRIAKNCCALSWTWAEWKHKAKASQMKQYLMTIQGE